MATLQVEVSGKRPLVEASRRGASLVIRYQRIVGRELDGQPVEPVSSERQVPMSEQLATSFIINDYAPNTPVLLAINDAQGFVVADLGETKPKDNGDDTFGLTVSYTDDVLKKLEKALATSVPEPTYVFAEMGEFKTISGAALPYRDMLLVVAPAKKSTIPAAMLKKYFGDGGTDGPAELSATPNQFFSDVKADVLNSVSLSIQGLFEFRLQVREGDDCWIWALSGASTFGGVIGNPQSAPRLRRVIWLPAAERLAGEPEASHSETSSGIPVDPSEQELLNSPELFADDPGTHCKPFSSPNRIVGEKSFHTVLRVTQPEISADAAAPKPPRPKDLVGLFQLDATDLVLAAGRPRTDDDGEAGPLTGLRVNLKRSVLGNLANVRKAMTPGIRATSTPSPAPATPTLTPEAELMVAERADILRKSVGRQVLTSATEFDWDDMTPTQASSLAYGHILEHRVRWRNNGYSLGNVLYSLALAPRQTKRILTVHSEVRDTARRVEVTTASEQITQSTTKDYSYLDAVEAGLSEWAKGGSSSSTTGAAGGFGLAIGPVVVGGGASHGRAESESWQEGGRKVAATEEQSLRDAIRQYGDSLRKLESVVIQEQTQEETTQAVSEIVRNPNYCHALTVVYHQILRHLRIDTETVGARECVFVPLAISPFTWSKMIRWRDTLAGSLRDSPLSWVLRYLEDVQEGFTNSEIAAGPRADQRIRYLSGSIYLQVAIERPGNSAEEAYDAAKWIALSPYINRPVRQIYERLRQQQSQMDQIFQSEFAPEIAIKWIDKLLVKVGGAALNNVDMTLSGRYGFNNTVRVDFTCTPDRPITRRDFENFTIEAPSTSVLTPGSVANVRQASIHYYTKDFDRQKASNSLAHDLISVADGSPQAGANLFLPIDDWEKVDQREFIRSTAVKLRQYLNERLEHFHKEIWRQLDPDKLYMLLDTIFVLSETDGRSVASVVERNPIAILGNSLVYRVASGAHLGIDGHKTAADLNAHYRSPTNSSEPIRVSLPTAGVYAQALLDDCGACEEHFGSTEWVLSDKEPELADLDPSMVASRRAAAPDLNPSAMPASIISFQNAPAAPAPSGFGGAFDALTNANAFRDMAGLAGTQANARAAMESAASLAQQFGNQAAEIRKAEIAAKIAKEKLAVIDKAEKAGGVPSDVTQQSRADVLKQMTDPGNGERSTFGEDMLIDQMKDSGLSYKRSTPDGEKVEIESIGPAAKIGELIGDPDAVVLANVTTDTLKRWGALGSELTSYQVYPENVAILVRHLRKSRKFDAAAVKLGRKYRSLQAWKEPPTDKKGNPSTAHLAEEAAIQNRTYTGKRFLSVAGELSPRREIASFVRGDEMEGYGDTITLSMVNQDEIGRIAVPMLVHEVMHALRDRSGPPPTTLADAIKEGIDEEISVREQTRDVLKEISPKNSVGFDAADIDPELRAGNVEHEHSPGLQMTYLENIATHFWLREAQVTQQLTDAAAEQLRQAADQRFAANEAAPVDQSEYSKMYHKRLRIKASWKKFFTQHQPTDADYIDKRNAKADEHVQAILDSNVMYRAFIP